MPAWTRHEYDILHVALAWLVGFAPLFWHSARARTGRPPAWRAPTWLQCVGLALVASPFVRMGLNLTLTVESLFTYTVLQPASRGAIWRAVWGDVIYDFLVPVVGLLLLFNAFPGWPSRRAPRGEVGRMLRSTGLAPRRTFGRDALDGFALFGFIAAAYVVAFVLSKTVFSGLSANGDESQYWINMTALLIVLRSGMAGLTEELLFRGLLLKALHLRLPFAAAAVAQALVFALIHSGYGTWLHVAGPFVFGLGMAWVARVLGVTVTAVLHAEVNIVFFAFEVADYVPQAWGLLVALAVVNVAALWLTRLEAVRLLWRSLLSPFRRTGPAEVDEPRAG